MISKVMNKRTLNLYRNLPEQDKNAIASIWYGINSMSSRWDVERAECNFSAGEYYVSIKHDKLIIYVRGTAVD